MSFVGEDREVRTDWIAERTASIYGREGWGGEGCVRFGRWGFFVGGVSFVGGVFLPCMGLSNPQRLIMWLEGR